MKSIVKDAMRRTLGPRDLAMAKAQGPWFTLSNGVNPQARSHTEDLYITQAQII